MYLNFDFEIQGLSRTLRCVRTLIMIDWFAQHVIVTEP